MVALSAAVTAWLATPAASVALAAISRIEADISSAPAATVLTLALTCSAAAETALACTEVSSAEAPIWVLVADSSSELDARVVADSRSVRTRPERSSTAMLNDVASRATSSSPLTSTWPVRSASARRSRPATACSSGLTMPRTTSRAATNTPAIAMALSRINSACALEAASCALEPASSETARISSFSVSRVVRSSSNALWKLARWASAVARSCAAMSTSEIALDA